MVDTNHDLHARVNIINEVTKKSAILLLRLPRKNWIFHPDNGNDKTDAVDIAVIKLPIPVIEGEFSNSFGAFIYEPNNPKDNQLPIKDALPPEQVVAFGFPGDIGFKLLEQRPMGRFGIIAMVTGEEFVKMDVVHRFGLKNSCSLYLFCKQEFFIKRYNNYAAISVNSRILPNSPVRVLRTW